MFGKGKAPKSSNDKFVMAAGRAVGNIKPPAKSENRKGRGTAEKTAPTSKSNDYSRQPTNSKLLYTETRGQSKGKTSPMRMTYGQQK